MTDRRMTDDRPPSISVRIEADFDLAISDVWPDGDEPDPITAADVVALIEKCGSRSRFLDDWSLIHDLDVTASVSRPNPHYGQAPMFGDDDTSGVAWLHESATAWDRSRR